MTKECFHCGLPVPKAIEEDSSYRVTIDDVEQLMCCRGCQAVAQAIVENGLTDFYHHRTENASQPEDFIPAELLVYDNESLQKTFVRTVLDSDSTETDGAIREASLILEGIVCAACVWLNERHVKQLPGVIDFRVNYSTHRASLKWDNSRIRLSDVLKAISEIGYRAHPFDPGRMETLQKKERSASLRRIAVAGIGMMQVMMPAVAMYLGEASDMTENMRHFLRWISLIITTPVVLYSSRVFFTSAWKDLKRKQMGMDVPVSIAIGSAYLASVWATLSNSGEVYFDSVTMFTFFLLVGRYLEMGARHKAGQVAEELVRLIPATATRIETDVDGNRVQNVIVASDLELGDRVLIKPGETVPADGRVVEGASSINESLLTGESLPRNKQAGDELIGGTLNVESPLIMRVEKLGDSTILSSIIHLLDRAQTEKPNLARLADKGTAWFVLALLLIAVAVFIYWWFQEPARAFWVTLSVLVVTCPCALSLATPAALTAATGKLTEKGVLTTRGHALETLANITHIIFDKTGTLTHGRLQVMECVLLCADEHQQDNAFERRSARHHKLTRKGCDDIAAGLETASEHPLAQAILQISNQPVLIDDLCAQPGKGVAGKIKGVNYRIGTHKFVSGIVEQDIPDATLSDSQLSLATPVYLAREGEWLAVYLLQDALREEAGAAIWRLKAAGINVSLLSGDTAHMVESVAAKLKIDHAKSGLLPEDKYAHMQTLQQQGEVVAMVGDGVNDAPVLAGASVSIAMGSGSQLAQASADMVLLAENLELLPEAIQISRQMRHIIHQNFGWAILYNVIAIPLAASGVVSPWMAAIGMSMSSLVVVLNALRLK